MAIILISQGFRGVDFLRKPSVYLHFKAFAGPTIYISSIGLDSSEYIGWELINVVFREIDGQMTEVGAFAGCIQGGFRDLNSDGTPEVLTSTCENSESSSDSYWSLVPEVKAVLGH